MTAAVFADYGQKACDYMQNRRAGQTLVAVPVVPVVRGGVGKARMRDPMPL